MDIQKNVFPLPKNWVTQIGARGKKVGVLNAGYGVEKVSYGLKPDGFKFVKVNRIPFQKFTKKTDNIMVQCPVVVGGPIDLLHSFNMLPLNKDFVLTTEMELPRFFGSPSEKSLDFGYNILRSDRCRGIYALSEAGKKFAQRRMKARGLNSLADTVKVFRGGFNIGDETSEHRPTKGPIKACIVGAQLFRKGIEATVDALQLLRDGGVEVELTVIGDPGDKNYAVPTLQFDRMAMLRTLEEKPWVTHYARLPNADVLALFRRSHILLFPSIDETLGWVPVEAGLCGMPRITTNIFAFPELIRDAVDGWMIDVPLSDDLRWIHTGGPSAAEAWGETKTLISRKMTEILGNKDTTIDRLLEMGRSARLNMDELYNYADARERLAGIYNGAVR